MSFATISLAEAVKKQYFFKMKANMDSFSALIWIQLMGMLFSFSTMGSMSLGSNGFSVNIYYYTSDVVIVFTMIWSFITAITITTRPFRYHDFTFITNRLSSSLSNILFLASANLFAALTAIMSHNLLQLIWIISNEEHFYSLQAGVAEHAFGIVIAFFYFMLFSAAGYFVGTLVQVSKAFIVIISALVIGSIFFSFFTGFEPALASLYQFYFKEYSMLVFFLKILLSSAILFAASISILNRLEVRR